MAYVNQTTRGLGLIAAIGEVGTGIAAFATSFAETWRLARIHRETYAQLDALSTRELADMGLTRSMISRVAYEAAYGPKA